MKKIAIIVSLCCGTVSINSHAHQAQPTNDVVRAWMQKQGFALEKGVTLQPAEKIIAPNSLNSLWVATPNTENAHQPSSQYRERIKELSELGSVVPALYKANANHHDRDSMTLRKNIADLHMAYSFTPVPDAAISTPYGFAACGTFNHDGWTGVTEYFQSKEVGNCAYTENNFALAHATASATDAVVRYDVNNKVTTVQAEGRDSTGYLYTVAWMDSNYFRTLECAVKHGAEDMTAQVVALAQRIDNP